PLLKGEVIGFYTGKVIIAAQNAPDDSSYAFALMERLELTRAEQRELDPQRGYHPRRLYAATLDARYEGNFTRFINHSETPNVEALMMATPKNRYGLAPAPMEIVYFVKKKILPGEQLLVSYEAGGKSYWKPSKIKPFPMKATTFRLDSKLQLVQD
ncbi:MAG: SET domain-containing protein, partial [Chlamydiae bacterium]|nr:SET domain-containing protein [Chlamydiota bacterium]